AWERSICSVLDADVPMVDTQRGISAKELYGVRITSTNPSRDHALPDRFPMPEEFVENYWTAMSDATGGVGIASRVNRPATLTEPGHNQLDAAIDQLSSDRHSRRAIVALWDRNSDVAAEHPPCACVVQFLVRDGLVNILSYFRSNDAWIAAYPDMVASVRLGAIVAERLRIGLGAYVHFAASYHIYEPDLIPAREAFRDIRDP